MRRVLALAENGKYTVSPNPRVGCVITKDFPHSGTIIAEGYHRRKGEPHAERAALRQCNDSPKGGTLYVNLEPCCHQGATPPCTQAVIEAGIKRVVISTLDPFPQVSGKGVEELRSHGIQVDVGLLKDDAWHLNRFFFHRHTTNLPWVMLKAAVSLDGKMASASGDSKWITSEESRRHVHQLRAEYDAILVGANTVKQDDPSLTVRLDELPVDTFKAPTRVVLNRRASIDLESKLVVSAADVPVCVFVSEDAPQQNMDALMKAGVQVVPVDEAANGLNLVSVLEQLARRNILSVMVEGGPAVHTAFLEAELVNELCIYTAPLLIGGKEAPSFFMGKGNHDMKTVNRLTHVKRIDFGEDSLINGILRMELGK